MTPDLVMSIGEHEKCTDERMCIACFSGQGKCENPTPPQPAAQEPTSAVPVVCKGPNCSAVDGVGHSVECLDEHDRTTKTNDLDTPGNRHPEFRYAGYKGQPLKATANAGQKAAYEEGIRAQQPSAVPVVEQFLQDGDQHLLHSFIETTEDDEGYMLTKPEIKRLAELGVVQSHGFGKYSVTMFGHWVHERYWHQNPSLPLKTNTDRTADAAIAAGQQYLKENGK